MQYGTSHAIPIDFEGRSSCLHTVVAGLIAPILANVEARMRADSANPAHDRMSSLSQTLVAEDRQRLAHLFKPFFHKYDRNSDGAISTDELSHLLMDLGEDISDRKVRSDHWVRLYAFLISDKHDAYIEARLFLLTQNAEWMARLDPDASGSIELSEFLDAMLAYVVEFSNRRIDSERSAAGIHTACSTTNLDDEDEDDGEEEIEASAMHAVLFVLQNAVGALSSRKCRTVEACLTCRQRPRHFTQVPEDMTHLDWKSQQRIIRRRAAQVWRKKSLTVPWVMCAHAYAFDDH